MPSNLIETTLLPAAAHPFAGEWDQTRVDSRINFPITKWHVLGALGGAVLVLASCGGGETTPSAVPVSPVPAEPTVGLFPSIAQSISRNIEFLIRDPLESFVVAGLSGATYGAIQLALDISKRGRSWTAEKGKGVWSKIRKRNGGEEGEEGEERETEIVQLTPEENLQMGKFIANFSSLVAEGTDPPTAMKSAFYRVVFQPAREKQPSKSGFDLSRSLMKIPREAKQWVTAAAFGFTTIKFLQLYAPEISTSAKAAAAVFAIATLTALASLEAILPEGWSFTLARKKEQ